MSMAAKLRPAILFFICLAITTAPAMEGRPGFM